MSTHMTGFQFSFRFLHHFVLVKLATSSLRVKELKNCVFFQEISLIEMYILIIDQYWL